MGIASDDHPRWSQPVRDMEFSFAATWELIAFYSGVPITGFNLRRKGDAWLLTVKARSAQRGAIVCFTAASSPSECVAEFVSLAGVKNGLNWKPDKYET